MKILTLPIVLVLMLSSCHSTSATTDATEARPIFAPVQHEVCPLPEEPLPSEPSVVAASPIAPAWPFAPVFRTFLEGVRRTLHVIVAAVEEQRAAQAGEPIASDEAETSEVGGDELICSCEGEF